MIATIAYKGQLIKFEITDTNDYLQKFWLRGVFYEQAMLQFIEHRWKEKALKGRITFIDVGACIGNHSIFFAKIIGAKVHAFEPCPPSCNLIRKNTDWNRPYPGGPIQVWQMAAGEQSCHMPFSLNDSGNSGMHKITTVGECLVKVNSLDVVLDHYEPIHLMKIDVEGYNIPVLKGATGIISKHHPEIYIECQTTEELREVEDFLLPIGYTRWPQSFNATPTYLFYY